MNFFDHVADPDELGGCVAAAGIEGEGLDEI